MRAVSLFAGAGGTVFGFSRWFRPIFAIEERTPEVHTLSLNTKLEIDRCFGFREAECGKAFACDIRQVGFKSLVGEADVFLVTPPATDFARSMGPRRRGLEGEKGSLVLEMIRAVDEAEPPIAVVEAVDGILRTNGGKDWLFLASEMHRVGYRLVYQKVLDYRGFGVPQMKRRLVAIFMRSDLHISEVPLAYDPLLFRCPLVPIEVFEGLPLDYLQKRYSEVLTEWEENAETLEEPFSKIIVKELDKHSGDIMKDYLKLNPMCSRKVLDPALERHREVLKELGYFGKRVSGGAEVPTCLKPTVERLKRIPFGKNVDVLAGTQYWIKGNISLAYKRLHPLKPSPTLSAGGGGGTYAYHYSAHRCSLTNEERMRLQTFPDSYRFIGRGIKVRRQVAGSTPPLVAKKIAWTIAGLVP